MEGRTVASDPTGSPLLWVLFGVGLVVFSNGFAHLVLHVGIQTGEALTFGAIIGLAIWMEVRYVP